MNLKEMFDTGKKPEDLDYIKRLGGLPLSYLALFVMMMIGSLNVKSMMLFFLKGVTVPNYVIWFLSLYMGVSALKFLYLTMRELVAFLNPNKDFEKYMETTPVDLEQKVFMVENEKIPLNNTNLKNYIHWNKMPKDSFNEQIFVLKTSIKNPHILMFWFLILVMVGMAVTHPL